jgi:HD domain-containing protein/GAF domain-containing protein
VNPEVSELQAKLKEILYDCAIELRATKAALYLYDPESKRYELITEYGFRGTIRPWSDGRDLMFSRASQDRAPYYMNGLTADPRFSDLLYQSASDRLLVAPVFIRGQLVGLIDMRDKAAKQAFDQNDVGKAQRIADRVAELFANKNIFNQKFITLSGAPLPPEIAPVRTQSGSSTPLQATRVAGVIAEAKEATARLSGAQRETLEDAELVVIRDALRSMLVIPGIIAASITTPGPGGFHEVVARTKMTDEALQTVQSKVGSWLSNHGESADGLRTPVQLPAGASAPTIGAAQVQKVFTAPVIAGPIRSLYLSVAFAGEPDRVAHDLLAVFHGQLQVAIEHSMTRRKTAAVRLRIAEKLLEPGFSKFPALRAHTDSVLARVESFARFLGLSPHDTDTLRVLTIVHDAGMRLLDYDRLYRKRDPSHDELAIFKEHPVVGAALVEPLLGPEIARAVLAHHERFEGGGYPNGIRGTDIPLPARILQICDAYEAMTAQDNYHLPLTHEAAMAVIARGAGTQFDGDLAARFQAMMAASR